ncbi:hypothetical protein POM88_003968 [Heracleum sosnowskyi]|uniref:Uncharacterized protein n=1 Tax=Heracleum sosnowskyi TaxID=360622 RepID=A0AAD8JIG7_9APIA|nr:hypothetical protein POM88_003968 [Heracleum sosnowskyi]
MGATLWSIWLYKNQLVFEKKVIKFEELIFLNKFRVLKWCEASNLCKGLNQNHWMINPAGILLASFKKYVAPLPNNCSELWGYIDGSFISQARNTNVSMLGIGGFIKDLNGEVVFIFSSPSKA